MSRLSIFVTLVMSMAFLGQASFYQVPYLQRTCEAGWTWHEHDDSCNRVFPFRGKENHTATGGDGVPMSYRDATALCGFHQGWIPAIQNTSAQLRFLMRLVRGSTKPGIAWWIGVSADRSVKDPALSSWMTPRKRPTGFEFRWDGARHMPDYEPCVAMHMLGDGVDNPGGNDKMITVDCEEKHHVVCTKPRVIPKVTTVEHGAPRRIEAIWNQPRTIYFGGPYIPTGTQVTMQTTDYSFPTTPDKPTHCQQIKTLAGASVPRVLNVTGRTFNNTDLCGGMCQEAVISFPEDWPWVRGAEYSFCFFIPVPFATPLVYPEWTNDLMPETFLVITQKHTEFLQDVCDRRRANVNLFYGDKRLDTNRDPAHPWYFDSPVEGGAHQP